MMFQNLYIYIIVVKNKIAHCTVHTLINIWKLQ